MGGAKLAGTWTACQEHAYTLVATAMVQTSGIEECSHTVSFLEPLLQNENICPCEGGGSPILNYLDISILTT